VLFCTMAPIMSARNQRGGLKPPGNCRLCTHRAKYGHGPHLSRVPVLDLPRSLQERVRGPTAHYIRTMILLLRKAPTN
jgi:hypothetical protein